VGPSIAKGVSLASILDTSRKGGLRRERKRPSPLHFTIGNVAQALFMKLPEQIKSMLLGISGGEGV